MSSQDDIEAVKKVLGEPIFIGLSDDAKRVRSRLMTTAILAIALSLGGLQVNSGAPIFGFQLSGITDGIVTTAITAILTYLLFHFLWLSVDAFREWRLRITGSRVAHQTVARAASEHGDYPNDPRQSTLYVWWLAQTRELRRVAILFDEASELISQWKHEVGASLTKKGDIQSMHTANQQADLIDKKMEEMRRVLRKTEGIVQSNRVPVSLGRFDKWHKEFSRSQNLRWLMIDICTPVVLGLAGVILLYIE